MIEPDAASEPITPLQPPRLQAPTPPAELAQPQPAPTLSEPARPASTRILAILNQKGGVGKTTTAVNLAAALARQGARVLMIDLDPQAHMTLHVGVDPADAEPSIYHLMTDDDVTAADVLRNVSERLDVLPAEVNLAGVESELAAETATGRAQRLLRDKCAPLLHGDHMAGYDYVFVDCPPSLGLLTINALVLAREVVVPMQAHFLALQGLSKLLETVALIGESFNPQLRVSGIVLCMYEGQTLLAGEVVADLEGFLESQRDAPVPWSAASLLSPPIRRNIKLAECPSFGKTIFDYEPRCAGAEDYAALAATLAQHEPGKSDGEL